jgi:transposase
MLLTVQPHQFDIFAGIDVDAKSFAFTHQDHLSKGRSRKMPASPEMLYQYFQNHFANQRVVFAYEAGGTGYGLYDYLVSKGERCIIVHPPSIQKAPNNFVKTNRIDSQKISDQLKSGQLKGIRVPSEPYRHLRHLVDLRQHYLKDSVKAKLRIKALLLFESIPLPENIATKRWSNHFIQTLKELSLKPVVRFKLDALIDDLEHAKKRILAVIRELRAFVKLDPEIDRNIDLLRSIPGIGPVVSYYLLARVGDPRYLGRMCELASFVGVVPKEHSTGDHVTKSGITHMGDGTLRSLLVEASWIAIRKDTELEQFYHRIRAKHGGHDKSARIAIVAVARKLTARIHRVLKDQRPYVVR